MSASNVKSDQPYPLPLDDNSTAGDCLDHLAAMQHDDDAHAHAYDLASRAVDNNAPQPIVWRVLCGYMAAVHPEYQDDPGPAPPSITQRARRAFTRRKP